MLDGIHTDFPNTIFKTFGYAQDNANMKQSNKKKEVSV